MTDAEQIQGTTTGNNDESVLLEQGEASQETPIAERIEDKLRKSMDIHHFDIVDTSGNCGSSFAVTIVSPDFAKKMPLARHKIVNQLLADEIAQLHAFSQKTLTPEQWAKEKK